jgi:hypothetical protein
VYIKHDIYATSYAAKWVNSQSCFYLKNALTVVSRILSAGVMRKQHYTTVFTQLYILKEFTDFYKTLQEMMSAEINRNHNKQNILSVD